MFRAVKSAAISAVTPVLRTFILEESLDADLVSLGIGGTLTLQDVNLNVRGLLETAGVQLPVTITAAFVQKLRLRVNWAALLTSPIVVEISGLYVCASADRSVRAETIIGDDLAALDALIKAIQEQLTGVREAESTVTAGGGGPAAPVVSDARARTSGKTWTMSLVSRIVDLVQISVEDVHIRLEYESQSLSANAAAQLSALPGASQRAPAPPSGQTRHLSCGLVLGALRVQSTDVSGRAVDSVRGDAATLSFIRKTVSLDRFGVYMDVGDAYRSALDKAHLAHDMKRLMWQRLSATGDATAFHERPVRRFLIAPTSTQLRVVINDSGNPPRAELERLMREQLGNDWLESMSGMIPQSLPPRALVGATKKDAAELQHQYARFVEDPIAVLCDVWVHESGAAQAASRLLGEYLQDDIEDVPPPGGKPADAKQALARRVAHARSVVGRMRRSRQGQPAAVVGGDGTSPAYSYEMELAQKLQIDATTAPRDSADLSHAGPVLAWFRRVGLDSEALVALAARFESLASARPAMIAADVELHGLAVTLSDAQYGGLMALLAALGRPPDVSPLPVDLATVAAELGLPWTPTPGTGHAAVVPWGSPEALGDHDRADPARQGRLEMHYRDVYRSRLQFLRDSKGRKLSAEDANALISGVPVRVAVKQWLIESFWKGSQAQLSRAARLRREVFAELSGESAPLLPARSFMSSVWSYIRGDTTASAGSAEHVSATSLSGDHPGDVDINAAVQEVRSALATSDRSTQESKDVFDPWSLDGDDDDLASAATSGSAASAALAPPAATEPDYINRGWQAGQHEPAPGEPEYLLHPALRARYRADDRISVAGCLYEYAPLVRAHVRVSGGSVRLVRLGSARAEPAVAATPGSQVRPWKRVRAAILRLHRAGVLADLSEGFIPLLELAWQDVNVSATVETPELIAVHALKYAQARDLRARHVRTALHVAPGAVAAGSNNAMSDMRAALGAALAAQAPAARIDAGVELRDLAVMEYATRSLRPFHLLRRYEPPAFALSSTLESVSGRELGAEALRDAALRNTPMMRIRAKLNDHGTGLNASGEMQRLDVKVSSGALAPIISFFALPEDVSSSLTYITDPLLSGAAAAAAAARTAAVAKVNAVLSRVRAWDDPPDVMLDVLIHAPRVLLPVQPDAFECDILVLSLGDLAITTSASGALDGSATPARDGAHGGPERAHAAGVVSYATVRQAYDVISIFNNGIDTMLVRAPPLGHVYAAPRILFHGESPWLLQPVTLAVEFAQCKSSRVRSWALTRAHVRLGHLHAIVSARKLAFLMRTAERFVAALPAAAPEPATAITATTSTLPAPQPDQASHGDTPRSKPSTPENRRLNMAARLVLDGISLTLAHSTILPAGPDPLPELPSAGAGSAEAQAAIQAAAGLRLLDAQRTALRRSVAPRSRRPSAAVVRVKPNTAIWHGVDYAQAVGKQCVPIVTLSVTSVTAKVDMFSDGLEVAATVRAIHAWDLLRLSRSGWMHYAAHEADVVVFGAAESAGAARDPDVYNSNDFASGPYMQAPTHPLNWCLLLTTFATKTEGSSVLPNASLVPEQDAHAPVDTFFQAAATMYGTDAERSVADIVADVNIGKLALTINRDTIAALLHVLTVATAAEPSGAPPASQPDASATAPQPAAVPRVSATRAGAPSLLPGSWLAKSLARGGATADALDGSTRSLVAACCARPSLQATLHLQGVTMVLNSDIVPFTAGDTLRHLLELRQPATASRGERAAYLSTLDRLARWVAQHSDFGFGACEVAPGVPRWRAYMYTGPLASVDVQSLFLAARQGGIGTQLSLDLAGVRVQDLYAPPHAPVGAGSVAAWSEARIHGNVLDFASDPTLGEPAMPADARPGHQVSSRQAALAACALPPGGILAPQLHIRSFAARTGIASPVPTDAPEDAMKSPSGLQLSPAAQFGALASPPRAMAAAAVSGKNAGRLPPSKPALAPSAVDAVDVSVLQSVWSAAPFLRFAWDTIGRDQVLCTVEFGCAGREAGRALLAGGRSPHELMRQRQQAAVMVDLLLSAAGEVLALPGGMQARVTVQRPRICFVNAFVMRLVGWATTGPIMDALATPAGASTPPTAPPAAASTSVPGTRVSAAALPLIDLAIADTVVTLPLSADAADALSLSIDSIAARSVDLDSEAGMDGANDSAARISYVALSLFSAVRMAPCVNYHSLVLGDRLGAVPASTGMLGTPTLLNPDAVAIAGSALQARIRGVTMMSALSPASAKATKKARLQARAGGVHATEHVTSSDESVLAQLARPDVVRAVDCVMGVPDLSATVCLVPTLAGMPATEPLTVAVKLGSVLLAPTQRHVSFFISFAQQNLAATYNDGSELVLAMDAIVRQLARGASAASNGALPRVIQPTPIAQLDRPSAPMPPAGNVSRAAIFPTMMISAGLTRMELHVLSSDVGYSEQEFTAAFEYATHAMDTPQALSATTSRAASVVAPEGNLSDELTDANGHRTSRQTRASMLWKSAMTRLRAFDIVISGTAAAPVAAVGVGGLAASVSIYSDGGMGIHASIDKITVADMRPKEGARIHDTLRRIVHMHGASPGAIGVTDSAVGTTTAASPSAEHRCGNSSALSVSLYMGSADAAAVSQYQSVFHGLARSSSTPVAAFDSTSTQSVTIVNAVIGVVTVMPSNVVWDLARFAGETDGECSMAFPQPECPWNVSLAAHKPDLAYMPMPASDHPLSPPACQVAAPPSAPPIKPQQAATLISARITRVELFLLEAHNMAEPSALALAVSVGTCLRMASSGALDVVADIDGVRSVRIWSEHEDANALMRRQHAVTTRAVAFIRYANRVRAGELPRPGQPRANGRAEAPPAPGTVGELSAGAAETKAQEDEEQIAEMHAAPVYLDPWSLAPPRYLAIPSSVDNSDVMKPFALHAHVSMTPQNPRQANDASQATVEAEAAGSAMRIDAGVCASDALAIRVGTKEAFLIQAALNTLMAGSGLDADQEAAEDQSAPVPATEPGAVLSAPTENAGTAAVTPAPTIIDAAVVQLLASVTLPVIEITVVNDLAGMDLPVLHLSVDKLQAGAARMFVEERTAAVIRVGVHADYYNNNRDVWEPFIEPVTFHLEYIAPEPLQAIGNPLACFAPLLAQPLEGLAAASDVRDATDSVSAKMLASRKPRRRPGGFYVRDAARLYEWEDRMFAQRFALDVPDQPSGFQRPREAFGHAAYQPAGAAAALAQISNSANSRLGLTMPLVFVGKDALARARYRDGLGVDAAAGTLCNVDDLETEDMALVMEHSVRHEANTAAGASSGGSTWPSVVSTFVADSTVLREDMHTLAERRARELARTRAARLAALSPAPPTAQSVRARALPAYPNDPGYELPPAPAAANVAPHVLVPLPADMSVRLYANNRMNINISVAFVNVLLDSYGAYVHFMQREQASTKRRASAAASARVSESLRRPGGYVYVRNLTQVPVQICDAAAAAGALRRSDSDQRSRAASGVSGATATMSFPAVTASAHVDVLRELSPSTAAVLPADPASLLLAGEDKMLQTVRETTRHALDTDLAPPAEEQPPVAVRRLAPLQSAALTSWHVGAEATPLHSLRCLPASPLWRDVLVAGPIYKYSSHKDQWYRTFAALFAPRSGHATILFFAAGAPPTPAPAPVGTEELADQPPLWMHRTCSRRVDLSTQVGDAAAWAVALMPLTAAGGSASLAAAPVLSRAIRAPLPVRTSDTGRAHARVRVGAMGPYVGMPSGYAFFVETCDWDADTVRNAARSERVPAHEFMHASESAGAVMALPEPEADATAAGASEVLEARLADKAAWAPTAAFCVASKADADLWAAALRHCGGLQSAAPWEPAVSAVEPQPLPALSAVTSNARVCEEVRSVLCNTFASPGAATRQEVHLLQSSSSLGPGGVFEATVAPYATRRTKLLSASSPQTAMLAQYAGLDDTGFRSSRRHAVLIRLNPQHAPAEVPVDVTGSYYLPAGNPYAPPTILEAAATAATENPRLRTPSGAPLIFQHFGTGVVADVHYVDGVKAVTVRSTVQVQNQLPIPLLVQYEVDTAVGGIDSGPATSGSPWRVIARRRLLPGEQEYAPIEAAARGRVRVAPMPPGYWAAAAVAPQSGSSREVLDRIITGDISMDTDITAVTPFALSAAFDLADLQTPFAVGTAPSTEAADAAPLGLVQSDTGDRRTAPTALANFFSIQTRTQRARATRIAQDVASRLVGSAQLVSCSMHADFATALEAQNQPVRDFRCAAHVARASFYAEPKSEDEVQRELAASGLTEQQRLMRERLQKRRDVFTTLLRFAPHVRIENLLPFPVTMCVYERGALKGANNSAAAAGAVRATLPSPPAMASPAAGAPADGAGSLLQPPPELTNAAPLIVRDVEAAAVQDVIFFARRAPGDAAGARVPEALLSVAIKRPMRYAALGWTAVQTNTGETCISGPGAACTMLHLGTTVKETRRKAFDGWMPLSISVDRASSLVDLMDRASDLREATWSASTAKIVDSTCLNHELQAAEDSLQAACVYVRLYVTHWFVNRCEIPLQLVPHGSPLTVAGSQAAHALARERARIVRPARLLRGRNPSQVPALPDETSGGNVFQRLAAMMSRASLPDVELDLLGPTAAGPTKVVALKVTSGTNTVSAPVAIDQTGLQTTVSVELQTDMAAQLRAVGGAVVRRNSMEGPTTPATAAAQQRAVASFDVGVSVMGAPGAFFRTTVVTLAPRYVLLNRSGFPVQLAALRDKDQRVVDTEVVTVPSAASARSNSQIGSSSSRRERSTKRPGKESWCPVFWPTDAKDRVALLTFEGAPAVSHLNFSAATVSSTMPGVQWAWSQPLNLDAGEMMVKLRRRLQGDHRPSSVVAHTQFATPGLLDAVARACSPADFCWMHLQAVPFEATSFLTLKPFPLREEAGQRLAPFRIENEATLDTIFVRQLGTGPARAENVPCFGSFAVDSYPYVLDNPAANQPTLLLCARPVGVPRLYYWAHSEVGRLVGKGGFADAARLLVGMALAGEEVAASGEGTPDTMMLSSCPDGSTTHHGRACEISGDRSWPVWVPRDGHADIPLQDIGAAATIHVGRPRGGAESGVLFAGSRALHVSIEADTSSGASKIIRIRDAPTEPDRYLSYLQQRLQETERHVQVADVLTACLRAMMAQEQARARQFALLQMADAAMSGDGGAMELRTPAGRGPTSVGSINAPSKTPLPPGTSTSASVANAAAGVALELAPRPPRTASARTTSSRADDTAGAARSQPASQDDVMLAAVSTSGSSESKFDGAVVHTAAPRSAAATSSLARVLEGFPETLWVQVVAAAGMPAADVNGYSDCFAVLNLAVGTGAARRQQKETRHAPHTLDPVWGECFSFAMPPLEPGDATVENAARRRGTLTVTLWDYDRTSAPDLLGQVVLDLSTLELESLQDCWYPLQDAKGAEGMATGSVRLKVLRTTDLQGRALEAAVDMVAKAKEETLTLQQRLGDRIRRLRMLQEGAGSERHTAHVSSSAQRTLAQTASQSGERPLSVLRTDAVKVVDADHFVRSTAAAAGVGLDVSLSTASLEVRSQPAGSGVSNQLEVLSLGPNSPVTSPSAGALSSAPATLGMRDRHRRVVGLQLEACVVETRGLVDTLASASIAGQTASAPRFYVSLASGNTVRRTRVQHAELTIALTSAQTGLCWGAADPKLAASVLLGDLATSGTRGRNVDDLQHVKADDAAAAVAAAQHYCELFAVQLHAVDAAALLDCVPVTSAAQARHIKPGMLLATCNGMSLEGRTYEEASALLRSLVTNIAPPDALHGRIATVTLGFIPAPEAALRDRCLDDVVRFADTALFGAGLPPPQSPPLPWLRHQLALVEQSRATNAQPQLLMACPNDPYVNIAVYARAESSPNPRETALLGSEYLARHGPEDDALQSSDGAPDVAHIPLDEPGLAPGAPASDTRLHLTPLWHLMGKTPAASRALAQAAGAATASMVDPADQLVAHRAFIPVPYAGVVIDRWFSLRPHDASRVSDSSVVAVAAPEGGGGEWDDFDAGDAWPAPAMVAPSSFPRVRVRLRWVPIYADRKHLRGMRVKVDLAGLGLSVLDDAPRELLYITLAGIRADLSLYNSSRLAMEARVHRFQLDSQVPTARQPVVLAPVFSQGGQTGSDTRAVRKRAARALEDGGSTGQTEDTVGMRLVMLQNRPVLFLEDVSVLLLRLAVDVDDELLGNVLKFVSSLHLNALNPAMDITAALQATHVSMLYRLAAMSPTRDAAFWGEPSGAGAARPSVAPPALSTDTRRLALAHLVGDIVTSGATIDFPTERRALLSSELLSAVPVARRAPAEGASRVYIGMLRLHPIAMDITFSISGETQMLSDLLPDIPVFGYLKNAIEALGTALANIDRAPVRLAALFASHVQETTDMLVRRLMGHIIQEAVTEWYKIIGSAEFLGNPVGLVGGLGRDVARLLYEPAAGLLDTPSQFGTVVATNAYMLVRNTAVGVVDSGSKVLKTVSKGLKRLNIEDDRARGARRGVPPRPPPRNVAEGAWRGGMEVGAGIVGGIVGIATSPVRGARIGGFFGALRGTASGVIGVVTKPTAGVLDGTVLFMRGITATLVQRMLPTRDRLPRHVGAEGVIQPYSAREAEGASRLWLLQAEGRAVEHEYVYHTGVSAYERFDFRVRGDAQRESVRRLQDKYVLLHGNVGLGDVATGDTGAPGPVIDRAPPNAGARRSSAALSAAFAGVREKFVHAPELLKSANMELEDAHVIENAAPAMPSAASAFRVGAMDESQARLTGDAVPGHDAVVSSLRERHAPSVVLVTNRRLCVLRARTNEVLFHEDLFDVLTATPPTLSNGAAVDVARAGAHGRRSKRSSNIAAGLLRGVSSVAFGATTTLASTATHIATGVASGVGAGLSFVAGLATGEGGRAISRYERRPRLHVLVDGPVVVVTVPARNDGFALLCADAEDATTLRRAIVLAMQGQQDRDKLRAMESASRTRAQLDARETTERSLRVSLAHARLIKRVVRAKFTRIARIAEAMIVASARVPRRLLQQQGPDSSAVLPVVPGSVAAGPLALAGLVRSAYLQHARDRPAGSLDAYAVVTVVLASAAVRAAARTSPLTLVAAPDNETTNELAAVGVVTYRQHSDFTKLWARIPRSWSLVSAGSRFVPPLPDAPTSATWGQLCASGMPAPPDAEAVDVHESDPLSAGAADLVHALTHALQRLVEAVRVEQDAQVTVLRAGSTTSAVQTASRRQSSSTVMPSGAAAAVGVAGRAAPLPTLPPHEFATLFDALQSFLFGSPPDML